MSELVQSQQGGSLQQASSSTSSSAVQSASFSSSSTSSSSMTSSSSTKVVKQSTTTVKQSSSSSSSFSSSSTSSSSSSRVVSVKSSGTSYSDRLAIDMGISDINKEMERLQLRLGDEMNNIHRDIFRLMPSTSQVVQEAIESSSSSSSSSTAVGGTGANQFLVKLDNDAIKSCIDKAHDDRVKLNFDVNEFQAETINIRTVGNKIEVHAMKKSKKGDEERSEEFSRVYELPTENQLDANHVSSSIYKDGVLTIELPLSDALGSALTQ